MAYIDDDDDDDPSLPLYQTMPYVCGKVLLASVLDSLVAAVSITAACCYTWRGLSVCLSVGRRSREPYINS